MAKISFELLLVATGFGRTRAGWVSPGRHSAGKFGYEYPWDDCEILSTQSSPGFPNKGDALAIHWFQDASAKAGPNLDHLKEWPGDINTRSRDYSDVWSDIYYPFAYSGVDIPDGPSVSDYTLQYEPHTLKRVIEYKPDVTQTDMTNAYLHGTTLSTGRRGHIWDEWSAYKQMQDFFKWKNKVFCPRGRELHDNCDKQFTSAEEYDITIASDGLSLILTKNGGMRANFQIDERSVNTPLDSDEIDVFISDKKRGPDNVQVDVAATLTRTCAERCWRGNMVSPPVSSDEGAHDGRDASKTPWPFDQTTFPTANPSIAPTSIAPTGASSKAPTSAPAPAPAPRRLLSFSGRNVQLEDSQTSVRPPYSKTFPATIWVNDDIQYDSCPVFCQDFDCRALAIGFVVAFIFLASVISLIFLRKKGKAAQTEPAAPAEQAERPAP